MRKTGVSWRERGRTRGQLCRSWLGLLSCHRVHAIDYRAMPARHLSSRVLLASAVFACLGASCRLTDGPGGDSSGGLADRWFTPIEGSFGWRGLPMVADGAVITGMFGGLAAFDTATGEQRWHAVLFRSPRSRPVSMNNVVVGHQACGADFFGIGCADTRSGAVIWNVTSPADSATAGGSSAADSTTLYYGTPAHRLEARSLRDGRLAWSTDLAPNAPFLTRVYGATVRNDTVYAATVRWLNQNGFLSAGDLVAVDAKTGRVFWSFTSPDSEKSGFQSPAVLAGNVAVVSDVYRHALRGIDLTTHLELWQSEQNASGYINAETPPIVLGDTVFAGSTDSQVYALELATGKRLWRSPPIGGSLAGVVICGQWVVSIPFGGGDPYLVDRATHIVSRYRLPPPGDYLYSQPAVSGHTLYATGEHGIHALVCN